jgi:uridine kinase
MPVQVSSVADAVHAVRTLVQERGPRAGATAVIAVDGPSGAGKSTLADALVAALGDGDDLPVVRLDDVYPGWDGLEAGVSRVHAEVLTTLAAGGTAVLRHHDWVTGGDGATYPVPPAPVVVLEGCGAGATVCAPYLSVLVWVDAPEAERYDRAMRRDGEAYRPHWSRWAGQEQEHFAREGTAARADVVLRT